MGGPFRVLHSCSHLFFLVSLCLFLGVCCLFQTQGAFIAPNCVTFDILSRNAPRRIGRAKPPKPAFAYADCSAVAERLPTALADSQDSIPG